MKLRLLTTVAAVAASASVALAQAPAAPPAAAAAAAAKPAVSIESLQSAAKVAAGTDWPGTYLRLCIAPVATAAPVAAATVTLAPATPAAAPAAPTSPPKATWYAQPAKLGDNFYFIGEKGHNSFALVGNTGDIIILDGLYDYATPDEIGGGLKTLGLDPMKVKYIIISHAHGDHDGGVPWMQANLPNAKVIYGTDDWKSVDTRTGAAKVRHDPDAEGTDGRVVSVGDASVKIVTTPGHTPGTLSFLFGFKDAGKTLNVAYVGGTAIPFDGTADYYDGYLASSAKFAKAAADFGATVLMSNHTEFDNGYFRAMADAARKPGDANAYEVGKQAVTNYMNVVQLCTQAAKLRATGKI